MALAGRGFLSLCRAEPQEGQEISYLAVAKATVANQTFIESGWQAAEEPARA